MEGGTPVQQNHILHLPELFQRVQIFLLSCEFIGICLCGIREVAWRDNAELLYVHIPTASHSDEVGFSQPWMLIQYYAETEMSPRTG